MLEIISQDGYCYQTLEEVHGSDGFRNQKPGLLEDFLKIPEDLQHHGNIEVRVQGLSDGQTGQVLERVHRPDAVAS